MDVRCIAREKDVAYLKMAIATMRNLKIRFPHCGARRLNVLNFINRVSLRTYDSPNWIPPGRLGDVVNDADEKNEPVAVEEKYVSHILFERRGERQVGEMPGFFKTAPGKFNIQSFSRCAVRSVGSQKPRREHGFTGIVRALSYFCLNSSGLVATANQFDASFDFAASFFERFCQQPLGGRLRKAQDERIFMMHMALEENFAGLLPSL